MRVWENAFAELGQHTSIPGVTAIVRCGYDAIDVANGFAVGE
jgi:hypothetical protein